jgi:hypothetical protein
MNAPVVSRPVSKLEDLPEYIRARMLEVQDTAGFTPSVFLMLAHRSEEFRAFPPCRFRMFLVSIGNARTGDCA